MNQKRYKYNFEQLPEPLTHFEKILANLELIRYIENPKEFYKETAYLKKIDQKITYYYKFSKIKLRKQVRGSGYLTHGFDFYHGSFHGQMVRGLINYCNLNKGSIILDPFCGSGTTLIESKLLGFNSIGIDINPIACLNTKVKSEVLETPINYLLSKNEKYLDLNYYENTYPININFQDFLNSDIKELFYVFLFTRAISDEFYISKNRKQAFRDNFLKTIHGLKAFEQLKNTIKLRFGASQVFFNDSIKQLGLMNSDFIDAVITSPPYINLIDYIRMDIHQIVNLLPLYQIKMLRKKMIGRDLKHKRLTEKVFWKDMNIIFEEIYRILKLNRYFIIVIGDYRNMKERFIEIAKYNNFFIERLLKREVINLKNKKKFEYVLFLKKV